MQFKNLSHERIRIIHGYDQRVSKADLRLPGLEIKGLCLQSKRFGTEYAAQKINFLTSTIANGRPLPLWKVTFGSDKFLMSYYLFIFSSHQHVQHMTSQILLILIDFDSCFAHLLIWNYSSSNLYKATITWCDLSARFFCIDAKLLCEFESDKIWINEFE